MHSADTPPACHRLRAHLSLILNSSVCLMNNTNVNGWVPREPIVNFLTRPQGERVQKNLLYKSANPPQFTRFVQRHR